MINKFWKKHEGETALIIGNGPSLEKTPLEALMNKYVSFGANKIYGRNVKPNYLTCVDQDMLHDVVPWLIEHKSYDPHVFVPRNIPLPGASQLNVVIEAGFSKDASQKVVLGGTVTNVNLQLAYYMGFRTVLLVGIDHRYSKTGHDGKPGSKFVASGADPDHFEMYDGTPYFEPGKIYNRPELDAVAKYTYPLANAFFRDDGREIINLTPDSAVECFRKESVDKWI